MPTVRVRDCDFFYADDDFSEPWGSRETIFLQPQLFADHEVMRMWVPTLARRYRVIRLDRRGIGGSTAPPLGYEFTLESIIADMAAFLDELCMETVHYVGDSMGGMFGAAFAAAHPARVKTLVLCATPSSTPVPVLDIYPRDGYNDGASAVMAMGSWLYAHTKKTRFPRHGDELKERYVNERQSSRSPHVMASLIRMVSAPQFSIAPILGKIQAPTLLISPGKSDLLSLDEQARMLAEIPNCDQVIFDDAGWAVAFDEPDRCAAAALNFITEHSRNARGM